MLTKVNMSTPSWENGWLLNSFKMIILISVNVSTNHWHTKLYRNFWKKCMAWKFLQIQKEKGHTKVNNYWYIYIFRLLYCILWLVLICNTLIILKNINPYCEPLPFLLTFHCSFNNLRRAVKTFFALYRLTRRCPYLYPPRLISLLGIYNPMDRCRCH